jgi:hypothetical protein
MSKVTMPTSRNALVNSPHYGAILKEYNEQYAAKKGKVSDKKFHEEFIVPMVPEYKLMSWYQFLRRWKDAAGLSIAAKIPLLPAADPIAQQEALLANEQATQRGIALMLNIGRLTLEELLSNPAELAKMPLKERVDLLTKAMKAQDSRIHAVGKIREDNRDQARFEQAFGGAAMND